MAIAPQAKRIKVIVVDDEPLARRNVRLLLARDPDIDTISEAGGGMEAIAAIRQSTPDLIFLDVQMPECDGFDVLEILGGDAPNAIVFVTAYDEYALRAFDAGALDYLLKPFDDVRFRRALDRAKDRIAQLPSTTEQRIDRLIVKSEGKVVFLDVSDIDFIEAANYYACVHTGQETHILRRTLAELEQDLGEARFFRIHRSVIVNLSRITGIESGADGAYEVILKSKARLRLSRRYRMRLENRMEQLGECR